MPYKKEKRGSQWCVIKSDGSGESMGCHGTEGEADRQIAALYANEPDAKVEEMMNESFGLATDKHHLHW